MLITEALVKRKWEQKELREKTVFTLEKGDVITPSARSFLTEKGIVLAEAGTQKEETKPEAMTHLRGNQLVMKSHPRIAFRGALDSLEAAIIETELWALHKNKKDLVQKLQETIELLHRLMRCEVTEQIPEPLMLSGLSSEELRQHSHHPSQYYGVKHFLPSYKQGEWVARLNILRTKTRETELKAAVAYEAEGKPPYYLGILQALNRLSSYFYILMIQTWKEQGGDLHD